MEKELNEIKKLAEENSKLIKKNSTSIKENFERINKNSFALEILRDYKKEAVIWKVAFFITLALLIIISIHHFIIG